MNTYAPVLVGTSEEVIAYLKAHPHVQNIALLVPQEQSAPVPEGPPPGVTPEMIAAMTEGVIWKNGVPTIPRTPGGPVITDEDVKRMIEQLDDEELAIANHLATTGRLP